MGFLFVVHHKFPNIFLGIVLEMTKQIYILSEVPKYILQNSM